MPGKARIADSLADANASDGPADVGWHSHATSAVLDHLSERLLRRHGGVHRENASDTFSSAFHIRSRIAALLGSLVPSAVHACVVFVMPEADRLAVRYEKRIAARRFVEMCGTLERLGTRDVRIPVCLQEGDELDLLGGVLLVGPAGCYGGRLVLSPLARP